jgi:hypothetical protein
MSYSTLLIKWSHVHTSTAHVSVHADNLIVHYVQIFICEHDYKYSIESDITDREQPGVYILDFATL